MKVKLAPFASILLVLLVFSSCRGSRNTTKSSYPINKPKISLADSTSATPTFAVEYSKRLGVQVPEKVNPLLITTVADWMGVPYRYGGNDKNGVDCSGFINSVYPLVYSLQVPRIAAQIQAKAMPVSYWALQEGDLVFFRINTSEVGHAGIYLFGDYFVHASTSKGVIISQLRDTYWSKYFVGGGRYTH